MDNEDHPEFPTIYAGADETEITDTLQQTQWFARIANRAAETAKSLEWTYEIGDFVLLSRERV